MLLIMASPPASPPPPPLSPPPPDPSDTSASPSAMKRTHKASRLRSLSTRPPGAERPVVHVDPATGKTDGPHKKKLRTYLGIVARDKMDVTYENWKEVPTAQKHLIWEDIQVEFEIPEASDSRMKRKLFQTVGERWRQFKSDLTRKWALAADQDGIAQKGTDHPETEHCPPTVCLVGVMNIWSRSSWLRRRRRSWRKLHSQEAAQSRSVDGIIDPPSPVRRHVKWKMARTKKTGEMTTEAAKEITEKIDSFEEQVTQGSFVPHGRQDVLTAAIRRPEHPRRVHVAGAGVTIKQYFGSAPRRNFTPSLLGRHIWSSLYHSRHLTETSMRAGNSDIYGFLEPQSIQRFGQSQFESESYIKTLMQSSKRDVYLGAYLNGRHWQMVVILPKEHLVVWFCSLHNRPDNYLKGIINSALKGLDDAPQPKSKAPARWIVVKCNRQKGSTECGYYVMHWMSTIILGTFRNNWEADPRPLEPERLKALRIQWAQYYLRVRDQT
ncbi:hypothetical protein HKD37_09G025223 [Glycine soja]